MRFRTFPFLPLLLATGAHAYDGAFKTIDGGAFNVDAAPVRYALDPTGSDDIADDSELDAVRDAFRAWACVPGTKLRFEEESEPGPAVLDLADGRNTVFWDETGALCGMGPGTLGITVGDVGSGTRVQADICFNGRDSTWGIGTDTDVGSIAVHEIGHFIGLDHPCDGEAPNETNCNGGDRSVMTPAWDGTPARVPLPDDEEGVRFLYPLDEGDESGCDGPFRAGEKCGCNDECVSGLVCAPDAVGDLRCGHTCSATDSTCGEGAVCVLDVPQDGQPAAGLCVVVDGPRPAGSVCTNPAECASGVCAANIAIGRSFCQQRCEVDDDCAGGSCFDGFCFGGFEDEECPVPEDPGCACTAQGGATTGPLPGIVATTLVLFLLRRRRRP